MGGISGDPKRRTDHRLRVEVDRRHAGAGHDESGESEVSPREEPPVRRRFPADGSIGFDVDDPRIL
jgi:hypothetical protein